MRTRETPPRVCRDHTEVDIRVGIDEIMVGQRPSPGVFGTEQLGGKNGKADLTSERAAVARTCKDSGHPDELSRARLTPQGQDFDPCSPIPPPPHTLGSPHGSHQVKPSRHPAPSPTAVVSVEYAVRAQDPTVENLDDAALEAALYPAVPPPKGAKPMPNMEYIHKELHRNGITSRPFYRGEGSRKM